MQEGASSRDADQERWDELRRVKRSNVPPPSDWPSDVAPITLAGFDLFGLDHEGRLYYDGKMVEVRKRLDLTRGERTFAIIVGAFTILSGVGAAAQGWAAAHQWSCQIGAVSWACPTASSKAAELPAK